MVEQDDIQAELRTLAARDWEIPPGFDPLFQSLLALLEALAYEDSPLIKARLQSTFEAIVDLTNEQVREGLRRTNSLRELWRHACEVSQSNPQESYDQLGSQLQALFDKGLGLLYHLRDRLVTGLEEAGHAVASSHELKAAIEDLQRLRQSVFENWPWSSRELPPVDRDMVAKSRALLTPREDESIEQMLERLGIRRAKIG